MLVSDANPAVVARSGREGIQITGPVENFTAQVTAVAPADLPTGSTAPS